MPRRLRRPYRWPLLQRGRERYEIACAPCHAATGDGDGIIVQRGFPAPPPLDDPRIVAAPTRHYYDVISNGYGIMYSFAERVAPRDRWAIAAYIRALQHARAANVTECPGGRREGAAMKRASADGIYLAVAVCAAALVALAAVRHTAAAGQAWLAAYLFWTGLPVGALFLVLVHGLTGGAWGQTLRPALFHDAAHNPAPRTVPRSGAARPCTRSTPGAWWVGAGSTRRFLRRVRSSMSVLWNAIALGVLRRAAPDGWLAPGFAWPALILLFGSTSLAAFDWVDEHRAALDIDDFRPVGNGGLGTERHRGGTRACLEIRPAESRARRSTDRPASCSRWSSYGRTCRWSS